MDQTGEQDVQVIHSYDTERHRVLCGMPGVTRSTKHAAGVTCTACLELLREARAARQAGASADPASRN